MRQPQRPLETLIFDFDYTLVDSSRGTIDGVNFALHKMGLPTAPEAAIRETIGLSLPEILVKFAGERYRPRLPELTAFFFQRADETMVKTAKFYEQVPHTLRTLRQHGLRLAIVSQKTRAYIEPILEREGLLEIFGPIIGGTDAPYKPDPTGLHRAVRETAASRERCVYIGDSVTDAETARRAEMPFIAVLSGVTPETDFAEYDTYAILATVPELLELVPWQG